MCVLAYVVWESRSRLAIQLRLLPETLWPRVLTATMERTLTPKSVFSECAVCPDMVVIPSGRYDMGSNDGDADEKPVHQVRIDVPLAISRFEITFDQWDACWALGGCSHRPGDQGWGRADRPVMNVNWYDAQQYAAWLSKLTGKPYRLLSEAEWEYAARAGGSARYAPDGGPEPAKANCAGCGSQWDNTETAPAGSFEPNPWGLHDMHGNVWEWVQDCYEESYRNAAIDGAARVTADCDLRVLRGGSWDFGRRSLRSTVRLRDAAESRRANVGLRVARQLIP